MGSPESDKSWKNLSHTIRKADYTVATRDGRCVTGHVESFDQRSVTIKSVRIDRKDVVRVGDGTSLADHDPIYSGRSSWADLKSGVTRNCGAFRATDEQATCDGIQIGKFEVARGYYDRLAPASEWEHHVAHENVMFLAPRTWFSFALFPRIAVVLYDAVLPEENFKIECGVQ